MWRELLWSKNNVLWNLWLLCPFGCTEMKMSWFWCKFCHWLHTEVKLSLFWWNFCQWLHQSGAAIDKNVTKMMTFLFHCNKIFQGVIAPHMQEHIDNIKLCTPRIYQIHMLISVLLCPCLELVYYSLDYYWYTFRSHAKFPWVLIHFTAVGGLLL